MKPVLGSRYRASFTRMRRRRKNDAPAIKIEPRADELLRRMSSHVSGFPG
jgi:hypothetical protein